jgi:hypothetical protein
MPKQFRIAVTALLVFGVYQCVVNIIVGVIAKGSLFADRLSWAGWLLNGSATVLFLIAPFVLIAGCYMLFSGAASGLRLISLFAVVQLLANACQFVDLVYPAYSGALGAWALQQRLLYVLSQADTCINRSAFPAFLLLLTILYPVGSFEPRFPVERRAPTSAS